MRIKKEDLEWLENILNKYQTLKSSFYEDIFETNYILLETIYTYTEFLAENANMAPKKSDLGYYYIIKFNNYCYKLEKDIDYKNLCYIYIISKEKSLEDAISIDTIIEDIKIKKIGEK